MLLFACGNTQQENSNGIQNDTVRSEQLLSHVPKDSMIQNGEYIKYYKNGVVQMRGMMKEGQRDGVWKSFYENGAPWSETTFKDGKKDGKTTTWYSNEQKRYEGQYTDDKESGSWTYYDESGNVNHQENFDRK